VISARWSFAWTRSKLRYPRAGNNWLIDEAAAADGESQIRKDRMRAAGLMDSSPEGAAQSQIGYTFIYFDFHKTGWGRATSK